MNQYLVLRWQEQAPEKCLPSDQVPSVHVGTSPSGAESDESQLWAA